MGTTGDPDFIVKAYAGRVTAAKWMQEELDRLLGELSPEAAGSYADTSAELQSLWKTVDPDTLRWHLKKKLGNIDLGSASEDLERRRRDRFDGEGYRYDRD